MTSSKSNKEQVSYGDLNVLQKEIVWDDMLDTIEVFGDIGQMVEEHIAQGGEEYVERILHPSHETLGKLRAHYKNVLRCIDEMDIEAKE